LKSLFNAAAPKETSNSEVVLKVYLSSLGFHQAIGFYQLIINKECPYDQWIKLRKSIMEKSYFTKHPFNELMATENLLPTHLVHYIDDCEIGLYRRRTLDGIKYFWRRCVFGQNYRYDMKTKTFKTNLHNLGNPEKVWQIIPNHITTQFFDIEIKNGDKCIYDAFTNRFLSEN
jgi:hypothetical protein